MKRIHIIGIAFAAIFAFSMIGASGASALSLWDQCTKTASPLEFTESNCITTGSSPTWGWEEIKTPALATESLLTTLTLASNGTKITCEGFSDGFVGPGAADEVTKLLSEAAEEVTEEKPVECTLVTAGLCSTPVLAFPDGLPWLTLLTGNNDLLEGTSSPGWTILCGNGITNKCTRADSLLTVENLLSELEVDLGFKTLETATCTIGTGTVEGTVSILLANGNGLRAM
jgi:hypothetical protein